MIRPITSLLKQGVKIVLTPAMKTIVRTHLEQLLARPVLVYPDWGAVADYSRPFVLYGDASVDGFGATLEQEERDGTIRANVFIRRVPSNLSATGHRSISRLAESSGASSASAVICGVPPSAFFRTTRRSRVSQLPSPEMARIPHGIPVYFGIPQRRRQP